MRTRVQFPAAILCAHCLALCLAPVLLVWLGEARRPSTAARSGGSPTIRWTPGTRQLYRLESVSALRMHLSGSAPSASMEARLAGILELVVEKADEAGAEVKLRLDPASYSAPGMPDRAAEIRLSTPFGVAFLANGLPQRFDFPADLPAEARTVLEQLVRTFQVVVAPGAESGWTTREENGAGRYLADYRVGADGTIVKEKTGYETASAQATGLLGPLDVRILRSRALVRLDPGTSWVHEIRIEEETQALENGAPLLSTTLAATLVRTTMPVASAESPDRNDRTSDEASLARREAGAPTRDATPGSQLTTDAASAELQRLIQELEQSEGSSIASVHGIRDLVATCPEAAELVCTALLEGELGDSSAAALVHALELAGTPAAQAALGSMLGEARFGRANRLRAAIALGGQESGTTAARDALWEATLRRDADSVELSNTALLALGALAPAEPDTTDEPATVQRRLIARLAAAGDPDEAGILLGALGNTHDPALATTVTPYLEDASAYVRSSAADALGNMPGPVVEETLTTRLRLEENPSVRTALAAALCRTPDPSVASLELVQGLVRSEDSDTARLAMTRFLGQNLEALPTARQTLEELVLNARSPRVRSCAAKALLRP